MICLPQACFHRHPAEGAGSPRTTYVVAHTATPQTAHSLPKQICAPASTTTSTPLAPPPPPPRLAFPRDSSPSSHRAVLLPVALSLVAPLPAAALKRPLLLELVERERGEADHEHSVHDGHEHAHGHDVGDLVVYRPAGRGYQRGAPRERGVGPEGRVFVAAYAGGACVPVAAAAVRCFVAAAVVEAFLAGRCRGHRRSIRRRRVQPGQEHLTIREQSARDEGGRSGSRREWGGTKSDFCMRVKTWRRPSVERACRWDCIAPWWDHLGCKWIACGVCGWERATSPERQHTPHYAVGLCSNVYRLDSNTRTIRSRARWCALHKRRKLDLQTFPLKQTNQSRSEIVTQTNERCSVSL